MCTLIHLCEAGTNVKGIREGREERKERRHRAGLGERQERSCPGILPILIENQLKSLICSRKPDFVKQEQIPMLSREEEKKGKKGAVPVVLCEFI
jgi:hypothetical protein